MNIRKSDSTEQHPLLPSGDWDGFYVYKRDREKHKMMFMLEFKKGQITGSGSDDVGGFTYRGTYDLETMTCGMMKYYSTHRISYKGYIDENGIWGTWSSVYESNMGISKEHFDFLMAFMEDESTGGFHIWPSKRKFTKAESMEKAKRAEKVVELVQ